MGNSVGLPVKSDLNGTSDWTQKPFHPKLNSCPGSLWLLLGGFLGEGRGRELVFNSWHLVSKTQTWYPKTRTQRLANIPPLETSKTKISNKPRYSPPLCFFQLSVIKFIPILTLRGFHYALVSLFRKHASKGSYITVTLKSKPLATVLLLLHPNLQRIDSCFVLLNASTTKCRVVVFFF